MKRKLGLAVVAGALAVALALAATACGGGGDNNGVASLDPTTGQTTTGDEGSGGKGKPDAKQAALDFARCMREHGVDMPDPVNGRLELRSQRGDQRKVDEAQKACRHILEDAMPPLSEEQKAAMRDAALDFAKCMREHGVDIPDPVNGRLELRSKRGDQRKLEEAQKACRHILEDAMPPLSEEQQAEMREAALDFAKCMREHGVDMPDPTFQDGGELMRMPKGTKGDDPKVQEAQKACQPILDRARPKGSKDQGGTS